MFKKSLYLLLLPSLSWGASCVVPPERIELGGMSPGQSITDFVSKQKGRVIVRRFEEDGESREGRLEFKDNNNYTTIAGIGEVFIGYIAFNVDKNQITSFSLAPTDYLDDLEDIRKALIYKTGIPEYLWQTDKKDHGLYRYLCEYYEVDINQDDDRGEISIVLKSSFSESYNFIERKYNFTAAQFITPKVQKRLLSEGINYDNYELYNNDSLFRSRLDEVFLNKVGLKIDDFDMGRVLSARDITNGILTTNFYQKYESFKNTKIDMYIAYQTYNNHMLVVSKDTNDNIKVYGDKDPLLISAIVKSVDFPIEFASKIK